MSEEGTLAPMLSAKADFTPMIGGERGRELVELASRELTVVVGDTQRHNEDLNPPGQGFTSQEVWIEDGEGHRLVHSWLYPEVDRRYYSVIWTSALPPRDLVRLSRECLAGYVRDYAQGVETLRGELRDPRGDDIQEAGAHGQGAIIWTRKGEHRYRIERGLREPLNWARVVREAWLPNNWKQLRELAIAKEVTFVRFHTPIGDFCIRPIDATFNFGVISNLARWEGLADLMGQTSGGAVSEEKAAEYFQAIMRCMSL